MAEFVKLNPQEVKFLHEQNPDLVAYNVEFAEVTGGTFWKAYTPEQIAGTEPFIVQPSADGIAAMYKDLMQLYPPIDLYNDKGTARRSGLRPSGKRSKEQVGLPLLLQLPFLHSKGNHMCFYQSPL